MATRRTKRARKGTKRSSKRSPTLPSAPSRTARKIRLPYERDTEGRPLCRWCRVVVRPPRQWWCGDACVTAYRERYDAAYQRREVLKRDRGVCAGCRVDCVGLAREVMRLYRASGELAAQKRLVEGGQRATDLRFKGRRKDRLRPLWQADHTVPVVEGGGGVTIVSLQTLCLECHRKKTRREAEVRRAKKRHLSNHEPK